MRPYNMASGVSILYESGETEDLPPEGLLEMARAGTICVQGPVPQPAKPRKRRHRLNDGLPEPPRELTKERLEELVLTHTVGRCKLHPSLKAPPRVSNLDCEKDI